VVGRGPGQGWGLQGDLCSRRGEGGTAGRGGGRWFEVGLGVVCRHDIIEKKKNRQYKVGVVWGGELGLGGGGGEVCWGVGKRGLACVCQRSDFANKDMQRELRQAGTARLGVCAWGGGGGAVKQIALA
jgi:hypothetical protein